MSADWEPQILKWWKEGLDRSQIAERLGVTVPAVDSQINRMRSRGINIGYRQEHYRDFSYEPADFETANAVDPAVLIQWLKDQGLYAKLVNEKTSQSRTVCRWIAGSSPDFYHVDRVLTRLERHISELPPEAWLKRRVVNVQRDAA